MNSRKYFWMGIGMMGGFLASLASFFVGNGILYHTHNMRTAIIGGLAVYVICYLLQVMAFVIMNSQPVDSKLRECELRFAMTGNCASLIAIVVGLAVLGKL